MEKRNELAKELFVKIYFADNVDNTQMNSDAIRECADNCIRIADAFYKIIEEDTDKKISRFTKIVRENGFYLRFVPEELKTPEMCKLAVESHGGALKFVPEEMKTLELCRLAANSHYFSILNVPAEYREEIRKQREACE